MADTARRVGAALARPGGDRGLADRVDLRRGAGSHQLPDGRFHGGDVSYGQ